MLGALAGVIIGSRFERVNLKSPDFYPLFQPGCCFTDDSVLTVATADVLLYGGHYRDVYQHYGRRFPDAGYGGHFSIWIHADNPEPYHSWGNGSAMRVSPVGWARDTEEDVLAEARRAAEVTHNHPEGIKGAQAIALAVFLARTRNSKEQIREEITDRFGYDLNRTVCRIRPGYQFDVSCQGSVPEAIIAFLDSEDFESAIRLAISLGGDSDTIACMSGAIAQAFYGEIPEFIEEICYGKLAHGLEAVTREFTDQYIKKE